MFFFYTLIALAKVGQYTDNSVTEHFIESIKAGKDAITGGGRKVGGDHIADEGIKAGNDAMTDYATKAGHDVNDNAQQSTIPNSPQTEILSKNELGSEMSSDTEKVDDLDF